jgi:hypothetical protein
MEITSEYRHFAAAGIIEGLHSVKNAPAGVVVDDSCMFGIDEILQQMFLVATGIAQKQSNCNILNGISLWRQ